MKLHELSPVAGSTQVGKRKGRGTGSGNGKTGGYQRRAGSSNGGKKFQQRQPGGYAPRQAAKEAPASFEDKLKLFMQDSESRMADLRRNTDKKNGSRRRK